MYLYRKNISVFEIVVNELYAILGGIKWNINFMNKLKEFFSEARNKVYQTANFAMVEAYWNIGKSIVEQQDGYEKAEYGSRLIAELSKQMTVDFGKGFTPTNLNT